MRLQANLSRITRVLSILLDPFLPFGQNKIHDPLVPACGYLSSTSEPNATSQLYESVENDTYRRYS